MNGEAPVVFLIDDDASVREGVADLLRSVGLQVRSFASPQEFIDSKRPASILSSPSFSSAGTEILRCRCGPSNPAQSSFSPSH